MIQVEFTEKYADQLSYGWDHIIDSNNFKEQRFSLVMVLEASVNAQVIQSRNRTVDGHRGMEIHFIMV